MVIYYSKSVLFGFSVSVVLAAISMFALRDYGMALYQNDQWSILDSGAAAFVLSWPVVMLFGSFALCFFSLYFGLIFNHSLEASKKASEATIKKEQANILKTQENRMKGLESALEREFHRISKLEDAAIAKLEKANQIMSDAEAMSKRARNAMAATERLKKKLAKAKAQET